MPSSMATSTSSAGAEATRNVSKSVFAHETSEGAGARVRRSIGTKELRNLTPFLMLDHFTVQPGAGFPDHPHRGQQTVTYLFDGVFKHEDFMGYSGTLHKGDVQWMTAGKGVMHSEIPWFDPDPAKREIVTGLQLWIDLPAGDKYMEPNYQDQKAEDIPVTHPVDGVEINVLAGESHGTKGPITPVNDAWFLNFRLQKPGVSFYQHLPQGYNTFIYVVTGKLQVGDDPKVHDKFNLLVLSNAESENGVKLSRPADAGDEETRFVIVAGKPLDQSVVQYGPFVLNSQKQVMEAIMDFQSGKNGFERAVGWESKIGQEFHKQY
ncbi:hypothetical protein L204_102455 [Cryptococcus depauperatus]|nr:pirin [Cryptococcus depauperatus CBS 7855]